MTTPLEELRRSSGFRVAAKGRGNIPITSDVESARIFAGCCAEMHPAVTAKPVVVQRRDRVFPAIVVAGKTLMPIVDSEQILQWYYLHGDEVREANLRWNES